MTAWDKNNDKDAPKLKHKELESLDCKDVTESDEEPATEPVKVTQDCEGGIKRLQNENKLNLFEIAKRSKSTYQDVSFPADNSSLWWTA